MLATPGHAVTDLSPYPWPRSPIYLLQCLCTMELVTFDGQPYLWGCRPQESQAESWAPANNSHSDLGSREPEVVVLLIPASSLESFCLGGPLPSIILMLVAVIPDAAARRSRNGTLKHSSWLSLGYSHSPASNALYRLRPRMESSLGVSMPGKPLSGPQPLDNDILAYTDSCIIS